jgi:leucyl aminopeptidase (aminopeptidase T)
MWPLHDDCLGARLDAVLSPLARPLNRLIIISLENQTLSHSLVFRKAVRALPPESVVLCRVLGASTGVFREALAPRPEELSSRNRALLSRLGAARELEVRTSSGSLLRVLLNSKRYRWVSSRGAIITGKDLIIPAGEIATYPENVDGEFVADFAIHVNEVVDWDCRLKHQPVALSIKGGFVQNFVCKDVIVSHFLDRTFSASEHARRVGEVGFGTNTGVKTALPANSHANERAVGVHLGLGQHNQPEVPLYFCETHVDLIARGGIISMGSEVVNLENFEISELNNPAPDARDEDVFAAEDEVSCCAADVCEST